MKSFSLILLVCAHVGVAAQAATGPTVVTPELISELSAEAETNNASLWAARSQIEAVEWNARSIPRWRDPEVMVGGMAADRMMREEDGDIFYGVEQMLPIFGKEKAARSAAQAEVPVAEAELDLRFQTLRKSIAQTLYQAALADELLALAQEDVLWIEALEKTVEQRYEAGRATQTEWLTVQNQRTKAAQLLNVARNDREVAYATLNRLLNRNLHSTWLAHRLPELFPPIYYSEKLLAYAMKFEPKLKRMAKEKESAEAMAALTRKERLPDLGVGVEASHYSRTGEGRSASVLLKMNLPWVNRDKYNAAIRRDEARVRELEYEIEDELYAVQVDVHHMISMIDNARREALVYRDEIIPRSERALASARASWEGGRDAFRDVLESRRMLLEARTMYLKALAEQYQGISELVLCCGIGDLEALEMLINDDEEAE